MTTEPASIPWILKSTGEREPFSEEKLRRSLTRAGAQKETVEDIVAHIITEVRDGMDTRAIYRHAFSILKKRDRGAAATYSLRTAVTQLGPSGFPFEKFVAAVLTQHGYHTRTGVVVPGFCVQHEVDILAEKGNGHIFVECKFHSEPTLKSDVKVALYVHARFLDLQKAHELSESKGPKIHQGWLVTNTKATHDAIRYGECAGLRIIAWNYPHEGNLHDLIKESGVHPLTCLTTISVREKRALLAGGTVACSDLAKKPERLREVGVTSERIARIEREITALCHPAAQRP
ncbi:MAG: hypothetical protein A2408_04155 [Candidatus Yonathbacteria bacterium RIFOXYC1_FULL_52_10]|uniref:ATP-cone domain-containing protein n=1 Tax=Candidatus Yonathbacteria bacterium RIFOXYD1_FULL_52_36 TaxID=1802730 RepID=A0A1G2SK33_9BACT|nr:MAG: hypothetical protein A2408_04155 [Candidatus Yonathbacteria bacterium RIFOXYC1_FULL_52_10]OHA85092.1 MAG: hypothetical protein A2591_02050 [Candidatus Yonathbacteria bacterium RIFOXYD1_FULL_52_36]